MLIKAKHMDFDYSIHYDEQLDISSTNHFSPKETIWKLAPYKNKFSLIQVKQVNWQ